EGVQPGVQLRSGEDGRGEAGLAAGGERAGPGDGGGEVAGEGGVDGEAGEGGAGGEVGDESLPDEGEVGPGVEGEGERLAVQVRLDEEEVRALGDAVLAVVL